MSLSLLFHELQTRSPPPASDLDVYIRDIPFNSTNETLTDPDPLGEKARWLRAVVGVVSLLSMIGAVLIVLSFVCISTIRAKSREILVHLSLADFGVGCANFIGIVVDFDRYIRSCEKNGSSSCHPYMHLCTAQAFFAGFSTIASILWTLALSVYIYMLVVHEARRLHTKIVYFFYVFCWGMPLLISLWLVFTDRLGHSPHGGSGWCSLKIEQEKRSTGIFITMLGNDLWVYLTVVMVTLLYLTTHYHIRQKRKSIVVDKQLNPAVASADAKFLFIPLAFLLLRCGSIVVVIVFIYAQAKPSYTVAYFLICVAGIGDSGQGFVNAILFCAFTTKVREKIKVAAARLYYCHCWRRHNYNYDLQGSTNTSTESQRVVLGNNAASLAHT